jgi:hypothetical protein
MASEGRGDTDTYIGMEGVTRSTVDSGFGYLFIVIDNLRGDIGFTEKCSLEPLEGLTMLEPEEGQDYEVKLDPNSQRVVVLEGNPRSGYSYSMSYSYRPLVNAG